MLNKKMNSFLFLLENKMNIIDLSYRKLKPKSILSILRSIDEKEKVTSLDLEENFLYTDGLYRLFSYLKNNYPNLTRLNLKSTSISSQELFIISSFLKDFKYLKFLDLGFNIIIKSSMAINKVNNITLFFAKYFSTMFTFLSI